MVRLMRKAVFLFLTWLIALTGSLGALAGIRVLDWRTRRRLHKV